MNTRKKTIMMLAAAIFLWCSTDIHATTPQISGIALPGSGMLQSGQVLTISGSNMVNENSSNWHPFFKSHPNASGFEGAGLTADGYSVVANSGGTYVSDVKLLGNRSIRFHVAGSVSAYPNGLGDNNGYGFGTSTQDYWFRSYVRYNANNSVWPTGWLKMIISASSSGYGLYVQPQMNGGKAPSSIYGLSNATEAYGSVPNGNLTNDRWYCLEYHLKSSSPTSFEMFLDGRQVATMTPDVGVQYVLQFGFINLAGGSSVDLYQWMDGMASAPSRIYPASVVEISDNPVYGSGTMKYQEPVYLSDGSIQVKVDLSGLGAGPYYMWVTNNLQERSAVCNLSDALGGSGDTQAPTSPANLTATAASSSQINLSWSASSDNTAVTGYKIYRGGSYLATVTSGTTYSDTGLAASTSYSYSVSAIDAAGNESAHSAQSSATTSALVTADTVAPSVPTALAASAVSSSQVSLTFTSSTDNIGVTGYRVYRDGAFVNSTATNSYTDSGLSASTTYSYRVSAVDAAGNESGLSSAASVTTQAVVSAGTVLFQESFDDTNFSARGWYDGGPFVLSSIEHAPGSTNSAAFTFSAGASTPTSGGAIRKLFAESDSVYVSYWVKYASNWREQSGGMHHELYLLSNQDNAYSNLAFTHLTSYIETWGTYNQAVPVTPEISFQDGANVDQSKINVDLTQVTENRATSGCNGAGDSFSMDCYNAGNGVYRNGKTIPGTAGSVSIGTWHHVEVFIKLNSIANGKGVADGTVAYWLDGQQIYQHNNVMMRTAQYPNMKFNQFVIGPYMGNGAPISETFWLDDLVVATTRSGMAQGAPGGLTITSMTK